MLTNFDNPPKQFRPSPFWSWNDDLKDEELARQVRDFKEKGFGGYFMHSRVGLRTRYLSEEWMKRIATCLREGKKLDLESWLYDEDKWPSGAAGGLVTQGRDDLASRGLSLVESPSPDGAYLALFDLDEASGRYRAIEPAAPASHRKVAFEVAPALKTNWFNGEAYADLLNPEAVEVFLKTTYDVYAEEFSRDFGEFMPGIFTDEPHIRCGDLPWTDTFPAYFQEANGYDLLPRLPDLFFDLPDSAKTRYDFWRTVTTLFVKTFSKRLYDWCESHNVGLTGHYLQEDTLLAQMRHAGAAMPHYEYEQYPGIDHLGRNINNPLTLKQVSSVAHQLGRKRVLCEIFGVSGHSMSFEDQKWIADFHFAMGINLMCQHLVLYTMKGDGKRDYPPTFSYHQPYWPHYRYMNDYLARCSYAISQGKFAPEVLLLHPIATAWAVWRKGNDPIVEEYNRRFVSVLTSLLENHISFDLGDEMILEKYAAAEGDRLRVGEMTYECVIVPPSVNWSAGTVGLLKQFEGPILFVGEVPTMVGGKDSSEWKELLEQENVFTMEEPAELAPLLEEVISREVAVVDVGGKEIGDIYAYHRQAEGVDLYFLANTSRSESHAAVVRLAARGRVSQWHPSDGSVCRLATKESEGKTCVRLSLPPAGSVILTVDEEGHGEVRPVLEEIDRTAMAGPWRCRRTHPNSITLDYCKLSVNGAGFSDRQPVWKARREIQRCFGLEEFRGIQPWVMDEKGIVVEENSVELLFEFHVGRKPERVHLVVEEGHRFELRVNGQQVETQTDEWHWDRQFSKIDIREQVVEGRNEVRLRCRYDWDIEIEEVYVVGDFGVEKGEDGKFEIVAEPEKLEPGDWGPQGYPFFSGNMVYEAEVELEKGEDRVYLLDVSKVKGSLCRVAVNGEDAGLVAWEPRRIDVTRLLKDGRNAIEVEVVTTLRNTMGPLHHRRGDDLPWVGPEQFVDEANWTDEYQFVPYGIFGDLELVVCRRVP